METLTRQELIYAAHALRVDAAQAEAQAKDPKFLSSRDIFLEAANSKRLLSAKCERIAKSMPNR